MERTGFGPDYLGSSWPEVLLCRITDMHLPVGVILLLLLLLLLQWRKFQPSSAMLLSWL